MASVSLIQYIDFLQPQEKVPCCTACATLLAAEILLSISGNKVHLSRLYLYYMTQKMQNTLGTKGTDLKSTLAALSAYGAPPENFWPFVSKRKDKEPSRQVIEAAVYYRANSYANIKPDEFKECLDNNIPIIVGMWTGKLFWNISGEFMDHNYQPVNGETNPRATGHAVTIVGYDDELNGGSWIIANSLGPQWGSQGYAAIPYSCNIDIGESFIITQIAGIDAGKKYHRFDKYY